MRSYTCVDIGSNGYLWVPMLALLLVPTGSICSCGFLCLGSYVFLLVPLSSYTLVPVGSYGFVWVPISSY